jgi:hypothetical protein
VSHEEEVAMRSLIFAAIVALAGCTNTTIDRAEKPQQRPGTSLAFNVNNDADFKEGQARAAEWCAETYSAPARYIEERAGPTGRVAVFGCATN